MVVLVSAGDSMPFVKGRSGNPSGKPRGAMGLATRIKRLTRDCYELADIMLVLARDSNLEPGDRQRAIQWLTDRAIGRVADTQNLNHTGLPQPQAVQGVSWKRAQ